MTLPRSPKEHGAEFSPASETDVVDGMRAELVARPGDVGELRAVMGEVSRRKMAVVVRAGGTKLDFGRAPTRLDAVIDLTRLARITEHVVGDLVVRVEPGMKLADLQKALGQVGQRLSIDEVVPGSTVGGIVATGLSGPRRLGSGAVRDLLIGTTVIRADGEMARAGGKVVKNVAGYDLCKLYTGSYGTLGVLVETVFRLHPLPEDAAWVSISLDDEDEIAHRVQALLGSQLSAVALEIDRPAGEGPFELSVLFEGLRQSVESRCRSAIGILGGPARVAPRAPSWWGALPGPTTIKAMTTISGVPGALRAVADAGARLGIATAVRSSPGLGVVYVGLEDTCAAVEVETLLRQLRRHLANTGGNAIVLRAKAELKSSVDVWGPVGAIDLMRRVKANFDPDGLLAPGRFVGGI